MPSLEAFSRLQQKGVAVDKGDAARYNQNDTLADSTDLQALYNTLSGYKDQTGKSPVFTAASLVANPDFDRIAESGFKEYHYELLPRTLARYDREGVFDLWKEGYDHKLFEPQFHGREHLNVAVWMRALQARHPHTLAAFHEGCWGIRTQLPHGINYQAAFDLDRAEDQALQAEVIVDGLAQFKKLHSYSASFFVPPNGPFNRALESVAKAQGVQYLSTAKVQKEPLGKGKTRKVFNYLGKRSKSGLVYLTRNCFFEPSRYGEAAIESCLQEIDIAFRWQKPAVISTHRVNYIGALNETNRKAGLKALNQLLAQIIKRYPQVAFVSSSQLGAIITGEKPTIPK